MCSLSSDQAWQDSTVSSTTSEQHCQISVRADNGMQEVMTITSFSDPYFVVVTNSGNLT